MADKPDMYLSVIKMDTGGWSIIKANKKSELLKGGIPVAKARNKYDASKALTHIKNKAEAKGKTVRLVAM